MRTKLLFTFIFIVSFYLTQAQMSDTTLMIGKIENKQLKEYSWYEKTFTEYQPDNTVVKQLQMYAPKLKVMIVMGTWCGDSKKHVPAFWKVAEQCNIAESQVEMIGVDRKKHCPFPDISSLKIEYVPTFLVFYDNVQIGKIVETPKKSVEHDLLELLINMKQ
jgi:thiol-disulfide isomerase/thioredoxin